MKCPCQGCEKRELHCHSNCEGYKEWKRQRDDLAQKIADSKKDKPELCRRVMRHIWREMKRK